MLDIDEFKKYNDHFGHLNGDNRIKNFAARYGGEECVIILSDTEITGVHLLGENIVKNIIKQAIPHAPDAESQIVTLSPYRLDVTHVHHQLKHQPRITIKNSR
jgi:diguanylate cyclase (GGDEF)-like protein